MIYNAPIEKGIFLQPWKLARVTPVYKASNKTNVNNYIDLFWISQLYQKFWRRLSTINRGSILNRINLSFRNYILQQHDY